MGPLVGALGRWIYGAAIPPLPLSQTCGAPGGPPVTAPRVLGSGTRRQEMPLVLYGAYSSGHLASCYRTHLVSSSPPLSDFGTCVSSCVPLSLLFCPFGPFLSSLQSWLLVCRCTRTAIDAGVGRLGCQRCAKFVWGIDRAVELCVSWIEMEHEDKYGKDQRLKCDCLLFDLDDTLYPVNSGIGADVMKNIQDYMVEKLGVEKGISLELCILLYKQYGTTMAGLRAVGYQFDYDDYHSFVHGRLPYEKLKPDPVLRNILVSLPIRKVVFTNGDRLHASRALKRLGIEDRFEGVVWFETLNPISPAPLPASQVEIFDIMRHLAHPEPRVELPKSPIMCKPAIDAMMHALKLVSINPKTTILFDDNVRNIQAGKQIGMRNVLVGTSERIKGADHALESLHNMKEALPELWEEASII